MEEREIRKKIKRETDGGGKESRRGYFLFFFFLPVDESICPSH